MFAIAVQRLGLFVVLLVAAVVSTPALSQTVEIDPSVSIGPTILRAGWDIKAWPSRLNTIGEARGLYEDVDANFLRIPFSPNAHNPDGSVDESQYDTELEAIRSVLAVRPDVEIYASVRLSGANTFPDWVVQPTAAWPTETGSIFSNTVVRPNPEHYSTMVLGYLSYLRDEGISIDFLGLNNETEDAVPAERYIATYDLLQIKLDLIGFDEELNNIRYVGPDSFGLPTAERFMRDVRDFGRLNTIDFAASHYYPQFNSGNESDWQDLSALSSGRPLWHTELHMPGNAAAISELSQTVREALAVQFASFRNGVDSYIWWDSGNDLDQVRDVIKREVMTTTLGAAPVFTTPVYQGKGDNDGLPLFQAFVEGNQVTLWIANPGSDMNNLPVDMRSGQVGSGLVGEYYLAPDGDNNLAPSDTVPLAFSQDADGTSFTIDHIPSQSIAVVVFDMGEASFFDGNPGTNGTNGNLNLVSNFFPNDLPDVTGSVGDIAVARTGGNTSAVGIVSQDNINALFTAFSGGTLSETDRVVLTFGYESVGDIRFNGIEFGVSPNGTDYRPAGNLLFTIDDGGDISGLATDNIFGLSVDAAAFGIVEASLSDGFTATLTADVNGYSFDFTDVVVQGTGATTASYGGAFTGSQFLDIFSTGHIYSTTQQGTPTVFNEFSIIVEEDSVSTVVGDFDGDSDVDIDDVDFYVGNIGAAAVGALAQLDITSDGQITSIDALAHMTFLVETSNGRTGTFLGDLNLDGTVNVLGDAFVLISNLGNAVSSYADGDINFDGAVDVLGDAFILIGNLNRTNNP